LEGVTGILGTEFINFGDSYRSLMRRTQVSESLFKKLNRVVSPSEFYVGVSMIVPVQGENQNNKRISPAIGESLLELAVKNNTNVWALSSINDLDGSWDGLPNDTLFAPGESSGNNTGGLPSAFLSAEIRTLPIKQGGTGVIKISTTQALRLAAHWLIDRFISFQMKMGRKLHCRVSMHYWNRAYIRCGWMRHCPMEANNRMSNSFSSSQAIIPMTRFFMSMPLRLTLPPLSLKQQELINLTTPATPTKFWTGDFLSPAISYAESTYFTSRYGNRRTYIGQGTELSINGFHTGLDFGGGDGLAITAPAAGQVIFAGPWTVRGNATVIDHGWGVYSGFWHQSAIQVNVGDMVEKNQVIGLVGGTGRVTGAHLHWELWVNGIQVDPLDWLNQTYP
jgi:hypothetical protein